MFYLPFNTLRPWQNGRHFADDTFKRIFMNGNVRISINISLKFVPKGLNNNIPALVQIMAWRRPGNKPLSEPMMVNLLTHICVTRPQWINLLHYAKEFLICTDMYRSSWCVQMFWGLISAGFYFTSPIDGGYIVTRIILRNIYPTKVE